LFLTHHTGDGGNGNESLELPVVIEYAAHAIVQYHVAAYAPIASEIDGERMKCGPFYRGRNYFLVVVG
jgi:hypothetical protein